MSKEEINMIEKKSWDEFRDSKMLWYANRMLHVFGWAIVIDFEDGKAVGAYPARVKYRGFDPKSESDGFEGITKHLKDNIDDLERESKM